MHAFPGDSNFKSSMRDCDLRKLGVELLVTLSKYSKVVVAPTIVSAQLDQEFLHYESHKKINTLRKKLFSLYGSVQRECN